MNNFTINVRRDKDDSGSNSIELILPEGELMIIANNSSRWDDPGLEIDDEDAGDKDVDKALYYAIERIAQLEATVSEYHQKGNELRAELEKQQTTLEKERDDAVSEKAALQEALTKVERQLAGMAAQVELAQACVANAFEFTEEPEFISVKEALSVHDADLIKTLAKEMIVAERESNLEPYEKDIPLESVELVHMWDVSQCAEWLLERAEEATNA